MYIGKGKICGQTGTNQGKHREFEKCNLSGYHVCLTKGTQEIGQFSDTLLLLIIMSGNIDKCKIPCPSFVGFVPVCSVIKLKKKISSAEQLRRICAGQQNSRVLDDQKKSEDNQKLRFGCAPDYQIFWEENILKIIIHTNSLSFYSEPFLFQQIYHFGNSKQIAFYMVLK